MKLFKTRKSILAAGLATALAASGAGVAFGLVWISNKVGWIKF